jgi:hypothetical protein
MGLFAAGNGDGTFQPSVPIFSTYSNNATLTADLNGDGILDLVSNPPGGIAVRLGNGDGTFQAPVIYDNTDGAAGVVAGDFNADGKVDVAFLAIGVSSTSFTLLLGNGDGSFQDPLHFLLPQLRTYPYNLVAGDFNGDGQVDFFIPANFYLGQTPYFGILLLQGAISLVPSFHRL